MESGSDLIGVHTPISANLRYFTVQMGQLLVQAIIDLLGRYRQRKTVRSATTLLLRLLGLIGAGRFGCGSGWGAG